MNRIARTIGASLLLVSLAASSTFADDAEAERLKKLDAGPKVVDVSKYPEKQQANYKVFVKTCGKCHSTSRALAVSYSAPQWKRYVKRMAARPKANISPKAQRSIYAFLVYRQGLRGGKSKLEKWRASIRSKLVKARAKTGPERSKVLERWISYGKKQRAFVDMLLDDLEAYIAEPAELAFLVGMIDKITGRKLKIAKLKIAEQKAELAKLRAWWKTAQTDWGKH